MILMIDNYDSFVYNLIHYIRELGAEIQLRRNDMISVDEISRMNPSHIIISPGPCAPEQAGISLAAIQQFAGKIPILGVCLGHQAIGHAFGGKVIRALKPVHGKIHEIKHNNCGLFQGAPISMKVTRYHSLVVDKDMLPDCIEITATSDEGEIMALRHKTLPVAGVQFHPEAVLSDFGHGLLQNFLQGNL